MGQILYEAFWEAGPTTASIWHELSEAEQDQWDYAGDVLSDDSGGDS